MYKIFNGDCLQEMKNIQNNSVDLIVCDPPYGTIKGVEKNKTDVSKNRSGATSRDTSWDEVVDINEMFKECGRVLKKGRKLILFCQEPFTSQLIQTYNTFFQFNYKMIWKKNNAGNILGCRKNHVNYYEEILVFTKKYDFYSMPEIREYSRKIKQFFNYKELKESGLYSKVQHFTSSEGLQFHIPSEIYYNQFIEYFDLKNKLGSDFIEYSDLYNMKTSYDEKSIFNLWEGNKTKSNILEYDKPKKPVHPTQKPTDILEDIIKTFSNENELILDFTMGSGSTGVAALNCNRNFIGIEKLEEYYNIAEQRIKEVQ